jgi:hypothetical protein
MRKQFVYHRKAPGFIGTILYPLNQLKTKFPAVYENNVKKYQGREWMLDMLIPPLNALWNDVIHCSLMHPAVIYKTLSDMGFEHRKSSREWFEIPLCDISSNSILYRNESEREDGAPLLDSGFEPVRDERVKELSGMPEINARYYRKCLAEKQPPLLWGYAPHLLYKGTLYVTTYHVIDWRS